MAANNGPCLIHRPVIILVTLCLCYMSTNVMNVHECPPLLFRVQRNFSPFFSRISLFVSINRKKKKPAKMRYWKPLSLCQISAVAGLLYDFSESLSVSVILIHTVEGERWEKSHFEMYLLKLIWVLWPILLFDDILSLNVSVLLISRWHI